MEWGDRLEAVREAAQEKGNIMSVKITLTGRPGHIVRREGTVVLAMESSVRHAYACRLSNSLANTVTRPLSHQQTLLGHGRVATLSCESTTDNQAVHDFLRSL